MCESFRNISLILVIGVNEWVKEEARALLDLMCN